MFVGAAPHCGPRSGGASLALGWSVKAVKPERSGGSAGSHSDWTFDGKTSIGCQNVIFDIMLEVQKDLLEDISAGIGQFFKNLIYKNFVRNLTSKLARSALTSPSRIRV